MLCVPYVDIYFSNTDDSQLTSIMSELIQVTLYNLESELETLAAFERWLNALSENLDDRYKVGKARQICGCPLSVFLTEELGMRVKVGWDAFEVDDGHVYHTSLTRAFIQQIDETRKKGEPVTIAQARRALKDARAAIGGGN